MMIKENRLETVSKKLKDLLSKYNTQCALGHLSFLMTCITNGVAQNELGRLTSPMRQLYYLAGLMLTQESDGTDEIQFSEKDWEIIVDLLVQVESEYCQLFFPDSSEEVTEDWKKKVGVAMPTFLSYFNLGPLNFEEQVIEQICGTYTTLDDVINKKTGVTTGEYLQFYENLDAWCQYNFQSFVLGSSQYPLRDNWRDYTNIHVGVVDEAPEEIKQMGAERVPMMTLVADPGIKYRFKAVDLATNGLSEAKVLTILSQLSMKRENNDFLYFTAQNPLLVRPIVDLENGLYQVFEEKRVLHAILFLLEAICKGTNAAKARLTHSKGHYLEHKIEDLFRKFFGRKAEIISNYEIDGCEQDIIVLWNEYLFVIEAKAYTNREPFRNTEKAFTRIKNDFDDCIGYAYKQCKRVEDKMKAGNPFDLMDKKGKVLKTINPADYDGNDFYIIVNQESFGQIQVDLSMFLKIDDDNIYPWAVRYDDLEVFILTLMAKEKKPQFFVDFLIMREYLHGHIICSDEGEVCGGFITGKLTQEMAEGDAVITTMPDLASVFDDQYRKGMGFKNEKHWKEKHDGKTWFWG